MRRATVLTLAMTLAGAGLGIGGGVASAASWTPISGDPAALQWFYDADYSYRDAQSGKVVVMQAVAKPSDRIGPAGPGAPDGVGFVFAIDCAKKRVVQVSSYKPGEAPAEADGWRLQKGHAAKTAEDKALIAAVCPGAAKLPSR